MKGRKRNTDKGICILCSSEEDVKCLLLDCLEKKLENESVK